MSYVAVEENRQIYCEYHPGEKVPVVLVHGWGMQTPVWHSVQTSLQGAGHGVLMFDQRGCGKSDKDFETSSIATSAEDLINLMDHFAIEKVVLNGWSLGGAITVEAASRLGERCVGVISTAGATPRFTQSESFPYGLPPGSVAEMVKQLRQDRATFLHDLNENVFVRPVNKAVKRHTWQLFMGNSPCADVALGDLDHLDQSHHLKKLKAPFLALTGQRDAIVVPDIGRVAAEMAERGRYIEIEECGHAPFLEALDQYMDAVFAFLADIET